MDIEERKKDHSAKHALLFLLHPIVHGKHIYCSTRSNNIVRKSTLTSRTLYGYGIGHVLNDLVSAIWFTYMLLFYMAVVQLSSFDSGLLMLVGQISDAVATPLFGYFEDRRTVKRFEQYGAKKVWYVIGTIIDITTVPFMFYPCKWFGDIQREWVMTYYGIIIVIMQVGWAIVQTAHLGMAPVLTFSSIDRTRLLSLRNTFTVLCNIFVYVFTFLIIQTGQTTMQLSPKDDNKFLTIVLVSLAIGIFTSLFFLCTVQEKRNEDSPSLKEHARSREKLTRVFRRSGMLIAALNYMATRIYVNCLQTIIPLYLQMCIRLAAYTIAVIPLLIYIAGFVSSVAACTMNNKFGRKITYAIGVLFSLSASIWTYFEDGSSLFGIGIYLIALLFGTASSIFLVTSCSLVSDVIGDDIGNSALVYGSMSFVDKLSTGIIIMFIQYFQDSSNRYYYRDMLVFVCGGSGVMGMCVILFYMKKVALRSPTLSSINDI